MKNKKIVYVPMIADGLHDGHTRILEIAAKHGEVIVGLLTNEACETINDTSLLSYKHREATLLAIKYVSTVIPQTDAYGFENIEKIGANIVVHSDNWKYNHLSVIRDETKTYLDSIGCELIEPPYSKDVEIQKIKDRVSLLGTTTTIRLNRLRYLLSTKKILRIMEVHNAISGSIVEKANINNVSFDGMWSSSLTDSTSRCKPDIEVLDTTARLTTINEIFAATTKPLIYDGDTGGITEHFAFTVQSLERLGVSAVIIEDKCGLKKNSLFGTDVEQTQDSKENFCHKIQTGKSAQITNGFMIIARIESLILGKSVDDALDRAEAYINAGADGIMIHSKEKDGEEIFEFIKRFREVDILTPIVVVPTTYNHFTVKQFEDAGANIVIYGNHLLRSAYKNMNLCAHSILEHDNSVHADSTYCLSIKDILNLIPGTR